MRIRGNGLVVAVALALSCGPAAAINKCTLPGGKVVFQDAPCDTSAHKSETVKTWDNNLTDRSRSGSWRFLRDIDDMTGRRGCLVLSPLTSPDPTRGGDKFITSRIVVVVRADGETFAVRTGTDKDLFHNDLGGMGVKLNNTGFIPLDVKVGSHVVTSNQGSAVIAALPTAREARLRLRFWPYDTLYDTMTIDMSGFRQAYASAKQCAGVNEAPATGNAELP